MNVWLLRGGIEQHVTQQIRLRTGFIYPIIAESSATGDLKKDLPWPGAGASAGLGLVLKRFNIDFALYGDPARSYVEQTPTLSASGTMAYKF